MPLSSYAAIGFATRDPESWCVLELVMPPTNQLGSSVGERFACHGVVPSSIPGLAFTFSSTVRSMEFEGGS